MSKKIKIGVLGCANIAKRFVIPALKELEDFEIVGIASRTKEKADEFAEEFETKPFYGYDELLKSDIDAVYIPLPNSLHYEWIKKALTKELHVLVEKSMACDYKEVIELNDLAKEKGLVLIENFQFRFHSQLQYIKDLVDNNKIGELRTIRSSFGFPPFPDSDNIRYKKELGGGALLDAGAYPLKISQLFLGDDLYIDSANLEYPEDKEVDIWGSAYLKQKSTNVTSQISFGFDNYYQCNIELWGNKGKIYTNRIFTAGPGVEPTVELETNEGKEVIKLPSDHHFKNMLNYFYSQIIEKNKIDSEYEENINQARLLKELLDRSNERK
jgi:predicted dehydrogenase